MSSAEPLHTAAGKSRSLSKASHAGLLLQRKCACGGLGASSITGECEGCKKKRLQRKLSIGASNDPLEHEADQVADRVMAMSSKNGVSSAPLRIQRATGQSAADAGVAPASVDRVLVGSGRPLDPALQQDMGQRFGFSFSSVRIHTDRNADLQTRQQQAHAFTLGNDIFFRHGVYMPKTRHGRWLLAHELTHVVQQSQGSNSSQAFGKYGKESDTEVLEREADRCANKIMLGESTAVRYRALKAPQTFPACRSILDAHERQVVAEADVQAELATRLAAVGPVEREFPIPAGSFTPYRTDNPRRPNVIHPQIIGGRGRAGTGDADLALLRGQTLEIAEVKRGEWLLIEHAERQVENYVSKSNRNLPFIQHRWAQRRGHNAPITSVRTMPRSRLSITSPIRIGGIPTSTSWCRDGVIAFKAIGGQDPRIFVCGSTAKTPEQFIEPLVSAAELAVDRFIDGQLVPRIDRAIQSITIKEALQRMLSNPTLNQMLREQLGPAAGIVGQLVGHGADTLVDPIEQFLHGQGDRIIRIAIETMKSRVVAEVRRILKQQIRQTLQTILNALCVTAAQVTAEDVMRELDRRMKLLVAQAIPVAVVAVVQAVISELETAVGRALLGALKYIAIAVGVVIAAIALWEVAAAIAAGAAIADLAAAVAAFFASLGRALLPLAAAS